MTSTYSSKSSLQPITPTHLTHHHSILSLHPLTPTYLSHLSLTGEKTISERAMNNHRRRSTVQANREQVTTPLRPVFILTLALVQANREQVRV